VDEIRADEGTFQIVECCGRQSLPPPGFRRDNDADFAPATI
jgi:hypothetical protein